MIERFLNYNLFLITMVVKSKGTDKKSTPPQESPTPHFGTEFAPWKQQDKLEEGLVKTASGQYFGMNPDYAVQMSGEWHYFARTSEQDRLSERLVRFHRFQLEKYVPEGEQPTVKYVPVENLRRMRKEIEELRGCFVATAVYGNSEAPQVQALRDFRDNILMEYPIGRRFVDFYYSGVGRRTANFVSEQAPSAIPIIRRGLDALVDRYSAQKK